MYLFFWLGKDADDPDWDTMAEKGMLGPSALHFFGGTVVGFVFDYKNYRTCRAPSKEIGKRYEFFTVLENGKICNVTQEIL